MEARTAFAARNRTVSVVGGRARAENVASRARTRCRARGAAWDGRHVERSTRPVLEYVVGFFFFFFFFSNQASRTTAILTVTVLTKHVSSVSRDGARPDVKKTAVRLGDDRGWRGLGQHRQGPVGQQTGKLRSARNSLPPQGHVPHKHPYERTRCWERGERHRRPRGGLAWPDAARTSSAPSVVNSSRRGLERAGTVRVGPVGRMLRRQLARPQTPGEGHVCSGPMADRSTNLGGTAS